MKTLLAQDDFVRRLESADCLRKVGLNIFDVAGDEAETRFALRHAWSIGEPYDLVILGHLHPGNGASGGEVLGFLRGLEHERGLSAGKGAKVVVLTSRPRAASLFDGLGTVDEVFLQAPIDADRLAAALERLFGATGSNGVRLRSAAGA